MSQEQPKPPAPPWSECFTVSTPALAASVGSGDIWLAQSGWKEFRPRSKLTFTAVTGLDCKISPDSIANLRGADPTSLPTPDLTDVLADRYFPFMLEAVGMSRLRRWMVWATVALRTTRPAIA